MKAIKIIGHPVTTICLFLVILITGQSIGGVYLFYLILALPHGLVHSILAISGIVLLLVSFSKITNGRSSVKQYMNIAGILLLVLSLFSFFYNDKEHYNFGSFNSSAFWITSGLFVISALCFLILTFINFKREDNPSQVKLV